MSKYKGSIIIDRLDRCLVCKTYQNIHIHHVFGASNRKNSTKYGLVVPLCGKHHNQSNEGVHYNRKLDLELKKLGQKSFQYHYPELDFLKIFHRNYLIEEEMNE